MATYLVTYDLNNETVRPKITNHIYEYYGYARLSVSSYAVEADKSAEAVFADFRKFLDNDDQLYVIPLGRPFAGHGEEEINAWLDQNLSW